jgi:hypothetical protein
MESVRGRPGVVVGGLLIVVGAIVLLARSVGWTDSFRVGDAWALFIVVPGLVLYSLAFVVVPPKGVGFAIVGSIITALGLVLWVQQSFDRYDTWAYAWALVGPVAAGLGLFAYGLVARASDLVTTGLRVGLIGLVIFAVGMWYFEPVLTVGRQPVDLETWWPILLVGVGLLIMVAAFARERVTEAHRTTHQHRI